MATLEHFKRIHRIEKIFLIISFLIISGSSSLIGFWLLYPYKPLVFTSPVTLDKKEYHTGDRLTYTFSYCKSNATTGMVYRAIINGTVTNFTPMVSDLPTGCHTFSRSDIIIPEFLDQDFYHLKTTGIYQVNPIRTVEVRWESKPFLVKQKNENI